MRNLNQEEERSHGKMKEEAGYGEEDEVGQVCGEGHFHPGRDVHFVLFRSTCVRGYSKDYVCLRQGQEAAATIAAVLASSNYLRGSRRSNRGSLRRSHPRHRLRKSSRRKRMGVSTGYDQR